MAVNDIRSNLQQILAVAGTLAANGTMTGAILDTANFELGLMFELTVTSHTTGTFTLAIFESDDSGMSGETAVTGDQLIGTLPVEVAVVSQGDVLQTVGVISNKRYVRADVIGTDTSVGIARVIATQKAENMPV